MKKIIWFIAILLSFSVLYAQEEVPLPKSLQTRQAKHDNKERTFDFLVGGYVGAQFGSITAIEVSPHFGICPVDFLCVGIGGTYIYMYINDNYYSDDEQTHVFGGNAFVEGYVWDKLILHAEYEYLSFPINNGARLDSHALLAGPGYQQGVTDKLYVYGVLLFPVVKTENVYSIPVVRLGVNFRF